MVLACPKGFFFDLLAAIAVFCAERLFLMAAHSFGFYRKKYAKAVP